MSTDRDILYTCGNSTCKALQTQLKTTDTIAVPPAQGDIILCGNCGTVNVVTLLGLRVVTEKEFETLHPDDRAALEKAAVDIRKQQGKS